MRQGSPDCGAKALAIAAHARGSLDNISVPPAAPRPLLAPSAAGHFVKAATFAQVLVVDLRKRGWVLHQAAAGAGAGAGAL